MRLRIVHPRKLPYILYVHNALFILISHACEVVDLFSPLFIVLVYAKEPLSPMKQRLKEEGEGGEAWRKFRLPFYTKLHEMVSMTHEASYTMIDPVAVIMGVYTLCLNSIDTQQAFRARK